MMLKNVRRNRFRKILLSALLTVPVALVVLWMASQHKPGWYQPVIADDAVVQRAQSSTAEFVDLISDQLARSRKFEITLTDSAVNDWLASLHRLWPDAGRAIPREITNLAIRFDSGLIRLGGHCRNGELQSIINLSLAARVADDLSVVLLSLIDVHVGSLPIPRTILARLFEQIRQANSPSEFSKIRSVDELFEGIKIDNQFVWPNGDRPCRIYAINMDAGALRIGVEPL